MVKRNGAFVISYFCSSLAFAQLDSNSITVTASRNFSLQADQAVFAVYMISGMDAALSDVLSALQGSGITAANFAGVATTPQYPYPPDEQQQQLLQWAFALPVPLAKTKETSAMLVNLQKSVAQAGNGLKLTFAVQYTQVSQQAQQAQTCPVADLLADARAQAQKLADAAGLGLGGVLAMSTGTATTVYSGVVPAQISISPYIGSASYYPPMPCILTVKFAVGK
jgi:uncharacterized protein YggE